MRLLGLGLMLVLFGLAGTAQAARIGDFVETSGWEQAMRFLTLRDPTVRIALLGSLMLGLTCGLLGAFLVVRKMAMVGDVLSHAVLPGVAAGFLWNMEKDPVAIFVGATLAGLLGTAVVSWITQTTKLKSDTALALVLALFFAIGLVLMAVIQKVPTAAQSGLDKALLGQAAALGERDIKLMAGVLVATALFVTFLYKELLAVSFDPVFARTVGIPVNWVHHGFMFLLSAGVVVALQAAGVVLVSAMLVTPAATAYLLTHRMHRLIVISGVLGVIASVTGAFLSFLRSNLPTGPCMVLVASSLFVGAVLFSPKYGMIPRAVRQRSRALQAARENFLKAVYLIAESRPDKPEVTTEELAAQLRLSKRDAQAGVTRLSDRGLVIFGPSRQTVRLSSEGLLHAQAVVRSHRLWELYLTERANFRSDHVHESAEEIEHVLGEATVKALDRRLGFPQRDPHGRSIPRPE
jgi:ABC-type Mn2+/Zn2+ transport system permease subunit/Mn-dependent DtxR family transcriptional regulator